MIWKWFTTPWFWESHKVEMSTFQVFAIKYSRVFFRGKNNGFWFLGSRKNKFWSSWIWGKLVGKLGPKLRQFFSIFLNKSLQILLFCLIYLKLLNLHLNFISLCREMVFFFTEMSRHFLVEFNVPQQRLGNTDLKLL